jgi:hypothetical protein
MFVHLLLEWQEHCLVGARTPAPASQASSFFSFFLSIIPLYFCFNYLLFIFYSQIQVPCLAQ